ncbi:target of Sbf [Yamadazyma tenuis]|uniref:glucan endo-1,3-beta-D-glucosidase n=1 Tax=Candida tenuis (strain ATCC 10573 / BCRC 21748 / CBS 615 / JCM 9827 / NBRC 10315 / NRRL Y-1498 / VKM Y-70) TaxID=590646 RepID=G3B3K2_CANTC|nr:uncharacterized protein CANTEDRAFT_105324 [Yamadazyma tenuis ATCC 10573]EGV64173.1 hypothetical protein CANTEDRAFT_105324 [Yamadazyma tenuis ATCC 10573]WEJ96170.1 target of Sbf [Yamadazyma tenuis]
MKLSALYAIGLFLVSSASASCELSSDGNYYCSSTNKITYTGIGYSGSYDKVTAMDASSGSCSSESYSFSGNLSPLDEDLSIHFRGPIKLKQFAVYYPASSSNKKRGDDCQTTLVHKHHLHKRATQVVEVTQTVYVDANGVTQTTQATSTQTSAAANVVEEDDDTTSTTSTAAASSAAAAGFSTAVASSAAAVSSAAASSAAVSASSGDWERSAYYSSGSADGLVFFNHYGGSGSGVWDSAFGNSISYANSDASGGSSSPQVLDYTLVGSNTEFIIMSDTKCSGDDCGFYRDGIPAYKGFSGSKKVFVFEFQMPQATGAETVDNYDMPAIWALNAKIPRTLQYGKSSCSCWPGCGELDLFEILSQGSSKLISHLHSDQGSGGGGSQDYFERPYDSTLKAAVVFDGTDVTIVEVDDDFDEVLSSSTVQGWIDESGSTASI